jgi:hypothetical protein
MNDTIDHITIGLFCIGILVLCATPWVAIEVSTILLETGIGFIIAGFLFQLITYIAKRFVS